MWGGYSINCYGYRSSNYIRTEHSSGRSVHSWMFVHQRTKDGRVVEMQEKQAVRQ